MVIQQTYLLSRFVKTSSKCASAGCSPALRIFSLVTSLTWNATIIILGCQEVGQNETFIAPQRAYYLSGRKGKCYPSPNPSFCSHFPVPLLPVPLLSPPLSLSVLCVRTNGTPFFSFTSASHSLWLSCSSRPFIPSCSCLLPAFDRASTWDRSHIIRLHRECKNSSDLHVKGACWHVNRTAVQGSTFPAPTGRLNVGGQRIPSPAVPAGRVGRTCVSI